MAESSSYDRVAEGDELEEFKDVSDDNEQELSLSIFTNLSSQDTVMMENDMTIEMYSISVNNWNWEQVKLWLNKRDLTKMIPIFQNEQRNGCNGINGKTLLSMNVKELIDDNGQWNIQCLDIENTDSPERSPIIARFFRELTKLQLKSNDEQKEWHDKQTTIHDYNEMKRRITNFREKWDNILWIDDYIDNYGDRPNAEEFATKQGISVEIASVYLECHKEKEKVIENDKDELLMEFNVYNDCILWWSIIISLLKTTDSASTWLIFEKVSEITPGNVAIRLLEKYQLDLTRFDAQSLDQVAQNIVIGSQYPICAALRIAKWFNDRAKYDVARGSIWREKAEHYIEAAIDYLSIVKSDHFATILLEVKSDLDGLSALDMAVKYTLTSFVANNRVERVATSIMNDFEFLHPRNRDKAFEIDQLSIKLFWSKIKREGTTYFYFTPLGTYLTEFLLYFCYLMVFTALSTSEFGVYSKMSTGELIFWTFNMGYVAHGIQFMISNGLKRYFQASQSYFDTVVSILFLISISIRIYAIQRGPETYSDCKGIDDPINDNCWQGSGLNAAFKIFWSSATIILWLKLFIFCLLSHSLGPMVQMIFKMMSDIITFFEIMLILYLGFTMCLQFIMRDIHDDFGNAMTTGLTLFRAILGDFNFEAFNENEDANPSLILFGQTVMLVYLIIGSLVFLNLLIAMMAKTFDTVQKDTTSAIIFARFRLAIDYEYSGCFMPPPLNGIALLGLASFYLIEMIINGVRYIVYLISCKRKFYYFQNSKHKNLFEKYDLAVKIMPSWMRQRRLETDYQILYEYPKGNIHENNVWIIKTSQGPTICKMVDYRAEIMTHLVEFFDYKTYKEEKNFKKIKVSIYNKIEKKHRWWVDLYDLRDEGLIDFEQFENREVDQEWANIAHRSIEEFDLYTSPYWICCYCRGYVKRSDVSIKGLARTLNVRDIGFEVIHKAAPEICPNCFRVRWESKRWELVAEIISVWIFYSFVFPVLWLLFAILMLLTCNFNIYTVLKSDRNTEYTEYCDTNKVKRNTKSIQNLTRINSNGSSVDIFDDDDDDDDEPIRPSPKIEENCFSKHYNDKQLIAQLKKDDVNQESTLYEADRIDGIWKQLGSAKDRIDIYLLKKKIDVHILELSKEDELTHFEFNDDFINTDSIKVNNGMALWKQYFEPISTAIFKKIKEKSNDVIPLHLFARYPFDTSMIFHSMQQLWEEKERMENVMDCKAKHLLEALQELKFLNCQNDGQRQKIIDLISDSTEYGNKTDKIYDKFVQYLYTVQSLFQHPKKLKNMLRDVSTAIIERGVGSSVFQDQIYFLFEDIANAQESLPFFNSMRLEKINNTKEVINKLELWTIRSTLKCLYFLHHTVRENVLTRHSRIYVKKQELLEMVHEAFKHGIKCDDDEKLDMFPNKISRQKPSLHITIDALSNSRECQSMARIDDDISEHGDDDDDDDDDKYFKMQKRRLALFNKSEITKSAVDREISYIFDQIQQHQTHKITSTNIDYYRQHLNVKLLKDEESLQYIYEQLARYATFYPNKHCDIKLFKKVLVKTETFGNYFIDKQAIPKKVMIDNNLQILYDHLKDIYCNAYNKKVTFSLQDALSVIMIYQRIFSKLRERIKDDGDAFVVSHAVFCKFVDPEFSVERSNDKWSNKTKAASNLFQAVLDVQQEFVTLGQTRQSIDKLIRDVEAINCGELTRIMNHAESKMKKDNERCETDRVEWCMNNTYIKNCRSNIYLLQNDNHNENDEEFKDDKHHKKKRKKKKSYSSSPNSSKSGKSKKNPGLQFKHIDKKQFEHFIDKISKSFQNNIASSSEFVKISTVFEPDMMYTEDSDISFSADEEEEKHIDKNSKTYHGFLKTEKKLITALLENTSFDIIAKQYIDDDDIVINKKRKTDRDLAKIQHVFDTVLSFNSYRITLQQLFQFSLDICLLLKRNIAITEMMESYQKMMDNEDDDDDEIENNLKEKIGSFDSFYGEFFENKKQLKYKESEKSINPKDFITELKWFHETAETKMDLCHRLDPFWNGKIIEDICSFLESTEQIQGIYELKHAEFGQLKHSLNVNDEEADKLFHIIRFKLRSLTWRQFYLYFKFLLKMKYNVQKAINIASQREDTTLSSDGLKNQLKISCNDEAKWLFDKIDSFHGAKVTWKQIRDYISNIVQIRDEMRDFFGDTKRKKDYDENRAEIMCKMSENVNDGNIKTENKQNEILNELIEVKKQCVLLQQQNIDSKQQFTKQIEMMQKQLNQLIPQNK